MRRALAVSILVFGATALLSGTIRGGPPFPLPGMRFINVPTTIDPPFGLAGTSQAIGINPQGEVVGTYLDHGTIAQGDSSRTRSYLRDSSGNFTPLDFPDAENTLAIKMTSTGQVVGCYHHQNSDFAVSGGGT